MFKYLQNVMLYQLVQYNESVIFHFYLPNLVRNGHTGAYKISDFLFLSAPTSLGQPCRGPNENRRGFGRENWIRNETDQKKPEDNNASGTAPGTDF